MDTAELLETIKNGDIDGTIDIIDAVLSQIDGETWQERTADMSAALLPALILAADDGEEEEITAENLRDKCSLATAVRLSRSPAMPDEFRENLTQYLNFTPGFMQDHFNDDGTPSGSGDTQTAQDQHDYLVKLFFEGLARA